VGIGSIGHVHRVCDLAEVPRVTAHAVRGLLVTITAERGMAGHLIAATLGHEDERTTILDVRCVEATPAPGYPSTMPIAWTRPQRQRVQRALRDHPADSGRCEQAARRILPTAHERDAAAQIWQLWPADEDASFVIPKAPAGVLWYVHYTVEAEQHCVDALTGVDGTPRDSYLETHWKAPDQLRWGPG
jgi:hypothetical protein